MSAEPRCSFCIRPQSQVDQLFMGSGAGRGEGTPYICNRCIGTLLATLKEGGFSTEPDSYCRACGFRITDQEAKHVIKGEICRRCAEELSAWLETLSSSRPM